MVAGNEVFPVQPSPSLSRSQSRLRQRTLIAHAVGGREASAAMEIQHLTHSSPSSPLCTANYEVLYQSIYFPRKGGVRIHRTSYREKVANRPQTDRKTNSRDSTGIGYISPVWFRSKVQTQFLRRTKVKCLEFVQMSRCCGCFANFPCVSPPHFSGNPLLESGKEGEWENGRMAEILTCT
jgi:hypothetical protein